MCPKALCPAGKAVAKEPCTILYVLQLTKTFTVSVFLLHDMQEQKILFDAQIKTETTML